jgi:hypothetical protein
MGGLMKSLGIVAAALVLMFATACGGGSSGSPSSPSTPSTPTPTTITVYGSYDKVVNDANLRGAWTTDSVTPDGPLIEVGWSYWLRTADLPAPARAYSGSGSAVMFDVGSLAGRGVTRATLRLLVTTAKQDPKVAPQIKVNAFTGSWDTKTLSWNVWASIGFQTSGEAQIAAPSNTGPVDWDVTTIVRNWASGAWRNYGLKLSVDRYPDPGGYDSWAIIVFCGSSLASWKPDCQRPQLIIEYQ